MTANLTSQYYATSRDFLVMDTSRADVAAITAVFDADFSRAAARPGDGSDLVWSPSDSEDNCSALSTARRQPAHLQRGNGRHDGGERPHPGRAARR